MNENTVTERKKSPSLQANIGLIIILVLGAGVTAHLLRANLAKGKRLDELREQLASAEKMRREAPIPAPPEEPVIVQTSDDSTTRLLEGKLAAAEREAAELRQVIGEKDQEIASLTERTNRRRSDNGPDNRNGDQRRRSMSDYMERLRQENPERYEEIQTRIREMNARRAEGIEAQTALFNTVNMESLNDEELENHTQLLAKLQKIEELNRLIQDPLMEEQRGELYRQLRNESGSLRELLSNEREILLRQFAVDLGYKPEEAGQFSEYVKQLYETTSARNVFGWGGGRGGGPPRDQNRGNAPQQR